MRGDAVPSIAVFAFFVHFGFERHQTDDRGPNAESNAIAQQPWQPCVPAIGLRADPGCADQQARAAQSGDLGHQVLHGRLLSKRGAVPRMTEPLHNLKQCCVAGVLANGVLSICLLFGNKRFETAKS